MPYFQKTKDGVRARKAANAPLGVRLAKLAVKLDFSVIEIAKKTGASRTTVYSWFSGKGVTNAYKAAVTNLIAELKQR
jgi:transcriptional regulator with XRE-family HTH domain